VCDLSHVRHFPLGMRLTMLSDLAYPAASCGDPGKIDSITLVSLCAENPGHHGLWSEFLKRFGCRIRFFVRMTLRDSGGGNSATPTFAGLPMKGEADLIQETILRLVESDCAALRRFSGLSEENLFAYFAVITRSVVRDYLRRQRALKRPRWQSTDDPGAFEERQAYRQRGHWANRAPERAVLARELEEISLQTIRNHSGENADRDRLLFELYFHEGLSLDQISKCKGINLSRAGVEKALNRVKDLVRSAAVVTSIEARKQ